MDRCNRRNLLKGTAGISLSFVISGCAGILGGNSVSGEVTKTPPWVEVDDVSETIENGEYVKVTGDLTFSPDDDDWSGVFYFGIIGLDENDVEVGRNSTDNTDRMDPGETISFEVVLRTPPSEIERYELEVWDYNGFRDCETCGAGGF